MMNPTIPRSISTSDSKTWSMPPRRRFWVCQSNAPAVTTTNSIRFCTATTIDLPQLSGQVRSGLGPVNGSVVQPKRNSGLMFLDGPIFRQFHLRCTCWQKEMFRVRWVLCRPVLQCALRIYKRISMHLLRGSLLRGEDYNLPIGSPIQSIRSPLA